MNANPDETSNRITTDPKANPDPLTGEPGSHPVGTGAGAAGAGLAGAALGAIVGPVGSVAGAVIGAVVGGLTGKGFAEGVNPTEEATYWRENHSRQPYAATGESYDTYADAYRVGYEGHSKYGSTDDTFEVAEAKLRADYEMSKPSIAWNNAAPAARAAWSRVRDVPSRKV
jgi:hypothetical protein